MQCFSMWQPWASFLVHGVKKVETRKVNKFKPGTYLVHAAEKWNAELADLAAGLDFSDAMKKIGATITTGGICRSKKSQIPKINVPLGHVIGQITIGRMYPSSAVAVLEDAAEIVAGEDYLSIPPSEFLLGDYRPNRFAFVCSNPIVFPVPIPYSGRQGVFQVNQQSVEWLRRVNNLPTPAPA